jgi:UDPglucose--hexose-1-phosphate uridylyltransferase
MLREDEPWRIRVVPNLYEAASMELPDSGAWEDSEPFSGRPARGMHEVIIETPRHDEALSAMPVDHLAALLSAFQVRIQSAHGAGLSSVIVFKNEGHEAGASLPHPHSQLIALPWVPPMLATETRALQADSCFLCQAFRRERGGARQLFETPHYWGWVPPAGAVPCETLVAPKGHEVNFHATAEERLFELAGVLRQAWGAIDSVLEAPPMNLVLHTAPFVRGVDFHWHFELLPRVTRQAGFELGAGTFINPSAPEEMASRLREALNQSTP